MDRLKTLARHVTAEAGVQASSPVNQVLNYESDSERTPAGFEVCLDSDNGPFGWKNK